MRKGSEEGNGSTNVTTPKTENTITSPDYEDLNFESCRFQRTPSADQRSLASSRSIRKSLSHTYDQWVKKDHSPPDPVQSYVLDVSGHGTDRGRSRHERITMNNLGDNDYLNVGSSSQEDHTYAQMRAISPK